MTSWPLQVDTVVLDVDGTLVDSNYHHALAWWRALRDEGYDVPAWRIHRAVGMGGDRLVAAVAGDEVEGARVTASATPGRSTTTPCWTRCRPCLARPTCSRAAGPGFRVALASSGIPRHTRHAVAVLEADDAATTTTTSEDAEESKPGPELLEVALDRGGRPRRAGWRLRVGRRIGSRQGSR